METDEWCMVRTYYEQVKRDMQALHFVEVSATFRELGMLFGGTRLQFAVNITNPGGILTPRAQATVDWDILL
jgi:hypothetical protein